MKGIVIEKVEAIDLTTVLVTLANGAILSVPTDLNNAHYTEVLRWVSDGNVIVEPLPIEPTDTELVDAALTNPVLDAFIALYAADTNKSVDLIKEDLAREVGNKRTPKP